MLVKFRPQEITLARLRKILDYYNKDWRCVPARQHLQCDSSPRHPKGPSFPADCPPAEEGEAVMDYFADEFLWRIVAA
ncbi:hypothetical protein RUND412_008365, partial [Rhizina undulata]